MRIVNQNFENITEYDLTKGTLVSTTCIKENATPIDNKTKFAWYDSDYEEVQMYIPYHIPTAEEQISSLKVQLEATDYKIIKCFECQLLELALPYNVAEIHTERQALRDRINELEKQK